MSAPKKIGMAMCGFLAVTSVAVAIAAGTIATAGAGLLAVAALSTAIASFSAATSIFMRTKAQKENSTQLYNDKKSFDGFISTIKKRRTKPKNTKSDDHSSSSNRLKLLK